MFQANALSENTSLIRVMNEPNHLIKVQTADILHFLLAPIN